MFRSLLPVDAANETPLPSVKRVQRTSLACDACRVKKVKCSGQRPCRPCEDTGQTCFYRPNKYTRRTVQRPNTPQQSLGNEPASGIGLREGTQPQVFTAPIQLKTHRELRAGIGVSHPETGDFQFYGPSSHFCFIQRIYQRLKSRTNDALLIPPTGSVPEGVGQWGLEQFVFSVGAAREASTDPPGHQTYPSRDMSLRCIKAYFATAHPQIPILCQGEVTETWEHFWQPPTPDRKITRGYEVVYLVLAIGAQISSSDEGADITLSQQWAHYFYSQTQGLISVYEQPSLRGTQFLMLKAFYAFLVMRPNDAYLALGHATRSAMALGLDRNQVVDGTSFTIHRLKVTFWTLYSMERSSCLFTGRQSAFRDDQIDVHYPDDWSLGALQGEGISAPAYFLPYASCGWIRAMAKIGAVADKILAGIYSSKSMTKHADIFKSFKTVSECDSDLDASLKSLPSHLHFFDSRLAVGEGWQEVQRITLGLSYYQTRMLIHRPSLVLASFYEPGAEALKFSAISSKLGKSIHTTLMSARNIIELAYDVYFYRHPDAKLAGNLATFLIFACVTLLYEVFSPDTTSECARETFSLVDQGIRCIDQIQHVGPTTGKAVSLDIMRAAKEALMTSKSDIKLNTNIFNDFPWLHNLFHEGTEPSLPYHNKDHGNTSGGDGLVASLGSSCDSSLPTSTAFPRPDLSYMSHWLEAGFDPGEIPDCLF